MTSSQYRCALPVCGQPIEYRPASKSGYGHVSGAVDLTHLAVPDASAPVVRTWADVEPGDTITVKKAYNKRSFRIRVTKVDAMKANDRYVFVYGQRLTMGGRPSGLRTKRGCAPGERMEFVHIDDVTAIERARPVNPASRECPVCLAAPGERCVNLAVVGDRGLDPIPYLEEGNVHPSRSNP